MNLWVRRIGQLVLVAQFLFACKEDTSLLGFKNPNSKFEVRYVEIPIESSTYLVDSLSTSTYSPNRVARFLAGSYTDSELGTITAITQTNFLPSAPDTIDLVSTYDSSFIELRLDYYSYGSSDVSDQNFSVHELTEPLELDSMPYYMNRSLKAMNPISIGSGSITVDPQELQDIIADNTIDTIVLKIRLEDFFGARIFNTASISSDPTNMDSTYFVDEQFLAKFPGIAIKPTGNDKLLGFRIVDTYSKITVHYHTQTTNEKLELFFGNMAFNHITSDRTGSSVAELSNFYEDVYPLDDYRYSQSGVGIITKLDFTNYFNFTDTLPKILNGSDSVPAIVVNSAELLLSDIVKFEDTDPIGGLELIVLKDNNRIKPVILSETGETDPILISYSGWITYEQNLFRAWAYAPVSDLQVPFQLAYNEEKNSYSGFLSPFFQELAKQKEGKEYFVKYALVPISPALNQSVNRFGVHKDNIKLRIYYTIPNLDNIN